MKDRYGKELNKGDPVWMETQDSTGHGKIVRVNKCTCHVVSGFDLYKGVRPEEVELDL